MSLSDLASLGSLVSGVAVLISLVYLALQVRQTERNQQVSIRHSRASRAVDLQLALAEPAMANTWVRAVSNAQDLSPVELSQFLSLARAVFFHFEDSFYQREEGLLNDSAFETAVGGVRVMFGDPGARAAWKITRANFGGRFLDFMDGVARSASETTTANWWLDAWQLAVASEASRPPRP